MFLEALETNFHIIVLTEIGARNIGIVKHLLPNHGVPYILPQENYFGVGIYIYEDTVGVQIMDELGLQKSSIDHIFISETSKLRKRHTEIFSGTLYCDITDHLPCFVILTCCNLEGDESPLVRIHGGEIH